jgi:hypothetical protein
MQLGDSPSHLVSDMQVSVRADRFSATDIPLLNVDDSVDDITVALPVDIRLTKAQATAISGLFPTHS